MGDIRLLEQVNERLSCCWIFFGNSIFFICEKMGLHVGWLNYIVWRTSSRKGYIVRNKCTFQRSFYALHAWVPYAGAGCYIVYYVYASRIIFFLKETVGNKWFSSRFTLHAERRWFSLNDCELAIFSTNGSSKKCLLIYPMSQCCIWKSLRNIN